VRFPAERDRARTLFLAANRRQAHVKITPAVSR
jgi:hypothetical protein